MSLIPNPFIAKHLVRPERFGRLMHDAALIHVHLTKNPCYYFARKITHDFEGANQLRQRKMFAFDTGGKPLRI